MQSKSIDTGGIVSGRVRAVETAAERKGLDVVTGLIPPEAMTSETDAIVTEPAVDASPDDVAAVRELILRTHADAVPELIGGATIGELLASIAAAREAYARVAAQVGPAKTTAPAVPAGGGGPAPIDPAKLSAPEKIRRGLAQATARSVDR